ncbi:uncharacterized protein HMPREF1541_05575 [Cyphellophora europaea CBS 101466]|uniref:Nitrate reductase [NADPH] n=1 Tax=Cyphellophora europaea (strain CBS 101466) TaxID=1220924 RepID=W2RSC3_CYPE1|nr:uncharacterized protein HMPREF1541_05575 [Cyphellophora europaea CBS 101466]ETN39352.1 hypothetical protein HMPREF1541_05575 [Cyphellophora europaea CBS 101466]
MMKQSYRHVVSRSIGLSCRRPLLPLRYVSKLSFRPQDKRAEPRLGSFLACVAAAGIAASTALFQSRRHVEAEAASPPGRTIRLSEVREHGAKAERRWVVKGTSVYDITDWIPNHPGGEVILRAVGGVIDQYWDIFSIHKKQDVYDVLEQYYIGELDHQDLVDGKVPVDDIEDPFVTDPTRDPSLIVHTERPCNAEAALESLKTYITPNKAFYVRNHLWVPAVDEETFTLKIELPDGEEKTYTMQDLRAKFKPVQITATLQCSGNRRRHMSEEARYAQGLQWDIGGLSNATWTGVRLREVLAHAGFTDDDVEESETKHVQFYGAEAYGASIPVEKALDRYGDVLLVHTMNGEPLPRDHGHPLRVLVPGHVAARSVKWLSKIVLSEIECQSQWQQRDYKCFGPNQGGSDVDWDSAPAIQEVPVQSAIVTLRDVSADNKLLQVYGLEEDSVQVEGYALSGGGRRIVRVDVSADDGRSWNQADLLPDEAEGTKSWAWTRWRYIVPKRLAGRQFVVKAVDDSNNVQPESYEAHYNFRGNLTNGWHRVPYKRRSQGKQ